MSRTPPLDSETEAALLSAYAEQPPIAEARRRRKVEKHMDRNPTDGRSLRATGRTAQFNVGMKPDLKADIARAAKKAGVPITVWIERAALAYMGKSDA